MQTPGPAPPAFSEPALGEVTWAQTCSESRSGLGRRKRNAVSRSPRVRAVLCVFPVMAVTAGWKENTEHLKHRKPNPPVQTAVRSGLEGMARARQRREGRRAGEWNGVWTPRQKPRARANAPGDGAGLGAGTGQVSGVERAERRLRLRGRQGSAVLQGQLPPSFSSKLLLPPLL